jgi:hypothetical protein
MMSDALSSELLHGAQVFACDHHNDGPIPSSWWFMVLPGSEVHASAR